MIQSLLKRIILVGILLISAGFSFAAEDIEELRRAGDLALAQGDYLTARYYFERIRESDNWNEYPFRIDILNKLGMIHESQSQYKEASEQYREVLEISKKQENNDANNTLFYYELRYADCLERAGFYSRAQEMYQKILDESPPNVKPTILQRIIHNYGFLAPPQEQLDTLHSLVMQEYQNTLGWQLANLYRILGAFDKSYKLYEELWPQNPVFAVTEADSIIEVYTQLDKIDELLDTIQAVRETKEKHINYLRLELEILEQSNQGEKAQEQLEAFLVNYGQQNGIQNISGLVGTEANDLVVKWVDLASRFGEPQQVEQQIRNILANLPMDFQWHERLSNLLLGQGKKEEAVHVWKDWAEKNRSNPLAVMKAAQQLMNLDSPDTAKQLMNDIQGQIPPALSLQQGEIALSLNRTDLALKAFTIGEVSGTVNPNQIVSTIENHSNVVQNPDPLFFSLIEAATVKAFHDIPSWIRKTLLRLGIRNGHLEELESLAQNEKSGIWNIHLAQEALKQGKRQWARMMLESVPSDSLYKPSANMELASLVGEESGIPAKRKAASLLKPAIEDVLNTTPPVRLTTITIEHLQKYIHYRLEGYQPGEALIAIRCIENSSQTLNHPLPQSEIDDLRFARACAFIQLGSFQPAMELLDILKTNSNNDTIRLLKAKVLLALKKVEEAKSLLLQIIEEKNYQQTTNDALALYNALEPLVGEPLELFCLSQLYQLQGRYEDAIPSLRQLAVEHYGDDVEEWSRFTIGKLLHESGNRKEAEEEWTRLLNDVDHPFLHGLTRLKLHQLQKSATDTIVTQTSYQEIMLDFPETLFFDIAKMEIQNSSTRRTQ